GFVAGFGQVDAVEGRGFHAIETAEAPGGGRELANEFEFDRALGLIVGDITGEEFGELLRVLLGDGGVGDEEAEGAGVAGGSGFAFGRFRSSGVLGVGSVSGEPGG